MTDGGYSYTDFYRLRFSKRNYYEPKITFDREPIKAESFGQCIYEPKKRPRLDATACERIVFNDIETMWKTGNYSAEDKYFHPTKIYNVSEMQKYYLPNHTVPYNVDIPVFMPTDKIYLNNSRAAIDKQWNIFTQKTGITRKEQQKQKFISDDSDSIVATTAAPAAPVGGGGGGPPVGGNGGGPPPAPPLPSGGVGGPAAPTGLQKQQPATPGTTQAQQQPATQLTKTQKKAIAKAAKAAAKAAAAAAPVTQAPPPNNREHF
jgi:hypothetical protein